MKQKFYQWLYIWAKRQWKKTLSDEDRQMVKESNRQPNFYANGFNVTQHALIRYFERVEGYDLKPILESLTKGLIVKKPGHYTHGNVKMYITGHTIVSVVPNEKLQSGNAIRGMNKVFGRSDRIIL